MKRFLIELGEVLLLILFCPFVVIVLGTIKWVELIYEVIDKQIFKE